MKTIKTDPAPFVLTLLLLAHAGFPAAKVRAQAAAGMAAPAGKVARALGTRARARRVAHLRADDTAEGTRVTVTSDAPLSDYAAYRRGADFVVRIPQAESEAAHQFVSGRGLAATRVEQAEGDLLLVFRLEPGAAARVSQNFNRLEVFITAAAPRARAQEPGRDDERLRQVLKRVEELEARVRELEAMQSVAAARAAAPTASPAGATESPARMAEGASAASAPAAHAATHGAQGGDAHDAADHAENLPAGTPRMQIQGYADVNLRASNERGRTTSFGLGQLDLFITSRLSENFSVLGELILEAEEDNTFTFTAHRLLLRYSPRDYFTLSAGRDHTAIGYYNTAYHHGSWFQAAATRPYLFAFENQGGILPLHNVGVSVSGRIPSAPLGLRYVAEVGNGRSLNTTSDRSVASAVDENNGKAFNLALFARPPGRPGFQTGFSVYRDKLTPAGAAPFGETIMAAHLVYRSSRYEFLNEGLLVRHAARGRVFNTPGFYTQFARRFGNARPFFRYQYVNAPADDPVFGPLGVGRRDGPSAGLRYDVSEFAAFKMQYDRTRRRRREALDELILQLSFTF